MADAVHHALALRDEGEVQIGHQYPLPFAQRGDEICAFRGDDRAVRAAGKGFLQGRVRRDGFDLRFAQPAGGVDHETAGFGGMVAHGGIDLVGKNGADHGAGEMAAMDFLVLGHEGVAGEWVEMLPARKRADAPDAGLRDGEAAGIAHAPDHALMIARCYFPALEEDFAVIAEE